MTGRHSNAELALAVGDIAREGGQLALAKFRTEVEKWEKSVLALRELTDNAKEYFERLDGIREDLGEIRTQRNLVWTKLREDALEELKGLKESEVRP